MSLFRFWCPVCEGDLIPNYADSKDTRAKCPCGLSHVVQFSDTALWTTGRVGDRMYATALTVILENGPILNAWDSRRDRETYVRFARLIVARGHGDMTDHRCFYRCVHSVRPGNRM